MNQINVNERQTISGGLILSSMHVFENVFNQSQFAQPARASAAPVHFGMFACTSIAATALLLVEFSKKQIFL